MSGAGAAESNDVRSRELALLEALPALRRNAQLTLHGQEELEDALQDSSVRFLELLSLSDGDAAVALEETIAWLTARTGTATRSELEDRKVLPDLQSVDAEEAAYSADLSYELEVVRRAFAALPENEREVLIEVVLEGNSPVAFGRRTGRTGHETRMTLRVAKHHLRRGVLAVFLSDGAPSECKTAAATLPSIVGRSPFDSWATAAITHTRRCKRCRARWKRFAAIGSAFGVVPLLEVALRADPLLADADRLLSASSRKTTQSRAVGMAFLASGLVLGVLTTVSAVLGSMNVPAGSVVVDRFDDGGAWALRIDLSGPESWQLSEATVELGDDASVTTWPDGWDCSPESPYSCAISLSARDSSRLSILGQAPGSFSYSIRFQGEAGGETFTGLAGGHSASMGSSR